MTLLSVLMLLALVLLVVWIFVVRCRQGNAVLPRLRGHRYAHRGLHDETRPENSLPAFEAAIAGGYGAELDVHLTADQQLVVFHDDHTGRMCGTDLPIEQTPLDTLRTLHLGDTDAQIPLLTEVLPLFADTAPLIIELKTVGNNADALCSRVFEVLDNYPGVYCIESFDPRVLVWLRAHRPEVCRGQLAACFSGHPGLPGWQRFGLTHLLMNARTRPDFIAYDYSARRKTTSLNICRGIWGVQEVSWTVRSPEVMRQMERLGNLVIFEQFQPGPTPGSDQ